MTADQLRVVSGGGILLHLDGADIRWCVGAPITSAPAVSTRLTVQGVAPGAVSRRAPGTATWTTALRRDGTTVALVQDCADPDRPIYSSVIRAQAPAQIVVAFEGAAHVDVRSSEGRVEILARISPFATVFTSPAGAESFTRVVVTGAVTARVDERADTVTIECGSGETRFMVAVAADLAEVLREPTPYGLDIESRATAAYRRDVADRLTADHARLDALLERHGAEPGVSARELIDAAAYLISCQQAPDGAVIAGAEFPLAYLRDTYGVALGLRSLGLTDRAAALTRFRVAKWATFGDLANAESIGHDRIRHRHEFDDAESPAYAMLQALDALADHPDLATPAFEGMLDWCWRVQEARLVDGTLPFNGDETYIAGGFLDRGYIAHASFESSLLAIRSARRYASHLRDRAPERARAIAGRASAIAATFRRTFRHGGNWTTAGRPRFEVPGRFGVCESCGVFPTSTVHRPDGRYVCSQCIDAAPFPFTWSPVFVPTAMLLPALLPGDPLAEAEVHTLAAQAAAELQAPDSRSNGHDIPVCLLGLPDGHPAFGELLGRTLRRFDPAQGWSERYVGDRRDGSRLRPWETALNLHALLTLAGERQRQGG